jgi:hypothetical protein
MSNQKSHWMGISTFICTIALQSCSSDYRQISPPSQGLQAFTQINSALSDASGLIVNTAPEVSAFAARLQENKSSMPKAAFDTTWDDISILGVNDPRDSGDCEGGPTGSTTVKEFMGLQFSENAARCNGSSINIFGRIKGSFGIACAIMSRFSVSSSDQITIGSNISFTFDSAFVEQLVNYCGFAAGSLDGMLGQTVTMTAEASSSADFDRKMTLMLGDDPQVVYMRFNSSEIAIASNEDNSNGNQRQMAALDLSNNTFRAEYVSKAKISSARDVDGHHTFQRLFHNRNTNLIRITQNDQDYQSPNYLRYIASGVKEDASQIALSIDLYGTYPGSSGVYTGDYDREACVNSSTGDIVSTPSVSSGSFSCAGNSGMTADSNTAFSSVSSYVNANLNTWWDISSVAPSFGFDSAENMLTSGL